VQAFVGMWKNTHVTNNYRECLQPTQKVISQSITIHSGMTASLLADWIVDIDPELLQAYILLKKWLRDP